MNNKVLIADDEEDVLSLVASNLKNAGFTAVTASDGIEALEKTRRDLPALVVLDLMLPKLSGLDVCKALKGDAATAGIPIIMLTAKAEEVDRIVGLELGADDYITKPFSPRELVLRIKSVLRRGTSEPDDAKPLKAGMITIDQARHQVRVKNRPVELTAIEYKLLTVLIQRRGRVQDRDRLLNDVWGYETAIDTRTVDTHVRRLREKLGVAADCIETVRGFGYRISEE
ncbi:MAG: two-component system, OmpR family, phosphate regulon response regulator PhoB [Chthoniobacter sp.]|jgi:two-component system phosphate regulon response regulator PhoB|nr:two-component system, OmpR family, phosphate regulon response regulator PhoB [Chthoniobacter sp.]